MAKPEKKKNTETSLKYSNELSLSNTPGKQVFNYSNILQGNALNRYIHSGKKQVVLDKYTGKGEVKSQDDIRIFLTNYDQLNLTVQTKKLLDYTTTQLTRKISMDSDLSIEKLEKQRSIVLDVDSYMETCGLKDKKTVRQQLKEDSNVLFNSYIECKETRYISEPGKKGRKKETVHFKLRIFDKVEFKHGGQVEISFSMEIAKYLQGAYIMPYPDSIYRINSHLRPHSYYLARKIAEHHNMNAKKTNANLISVSTLLAACPDIPSYDEVISTSKHVTKLIIAPFERDLNALVEAGVLISWKYCNSNGTSLTEEQYQNMDYQTVTGLLIRFELKDYPTRLKDIT